MRPDRSMPPVTAIPELAYPDVPAAVAPEDWGGTSALRNDA